MKAAALLFASTLGSPSHTFPKPYVCYAHLIQQATNKKAAPKGPQLENGHSLAAAPLCLSISHIRSLQADLPAQTRAAPSQTHVSWRLPLSFRSLQALKVLRVAESASAAGGSAKPVCSNR